MSEKNLEHLGKRVEQRKGMVIVPNPISGTKEMVEGYVPVTYVSSHLTPEEAATLPADVEWKLTPETLAGHPKYMAKYQGRRFFCDKLPEKPVEKKK